MKFEKTSVFNFEGAIRGMRNPKESWQKIDSYWVYDVDLKQPVYRFGFNDLKLAQSLIKAGSEHRKFMRQIFVCVDITAPLYWWKEFDTYKVGTVANSTSTMHKLASTPITKDCFEMDDFEDFSFIIGKEGEYVCGDGFVYDSKKQWENDVYLLEALRKKYFETREKKYWKALIRRLPESWLQTRTVTFDYENLLAICSKGQRRFHKLTEWSNAFISWARGLPYAQELIFLDEKEEENA